MRIFRSMDASASGLTAERLRLDIIAGNLANANTTRTAEGGPYRRKVPVFVQGVGNGFRSFFQVFSKSLDEAQGVQVGAVVSDDRPGKMKYEPGHPDADQNGYVAMPNVDVVTEMVDMISATRGYEANVSAINAAKQMAMRALEIGRS
ncbi:MAG: flagellar basal body rod protein FlgC [Firmicutes bacterium]|nr:flagellar basal body rod protein FlgC [Bacillota bacterium]